MAPQPDGLRSVAFQWAARLASVLFGLLLAAALSELLLRTIRYSGSRRVDDVDVEAQGLSEIATMADLLEPKIRGRYLGRVFENNSAGFRGPEVTLAKPAGVFRIVVVGDSFTMGAGVRYEDAYPALLADALNSAGDGRRYEVLNLGVSGFNLHAIASRLRQLGMRYDPDLVVYGFTVNDVEGPLYRKSVESPAHLEQTPLRLLNILQVQWHSLSSQLLRPPGSYLWELDDNYFRNPEAMDDWRRQLRELARIARDGNSCLAVFVHTMIESLYAAHPFRAYYEVIRTEASALGIPVIESFESFERRRAESLWVSFVDHHPNEDGHRILLEALRSGLAGLPLACWKGELPKLLDRRAPEGN